jgi:hypothetical protein
LEACDILLAKNAQNMPRASPKKRGSSPHGQLAISPSSTTPHHALEPGRFLGHLLFGLNYARVHTTIARGQVLMRDLQDPSPSTKRKICAKARESARGVWKRFLMTSAAPTAEP